MKKPTLLYFLKLLRFEFRPNHCTVVMMQCHLRPVDWLQLDCTAAWKLICWKISFRREWKKACLLPYSDFSLLMCFNVWLVYLPPHLALYELSIWLLTRRSLYQNILSSVCFNPPSWLTPYYNGLKCSQFDPYTHVIRSIVLPL